MRQARRRENTERTLTTERNDAAHQLFTSLFTLARMPMTMPGRFNRTRRTWAEKERLETVGPGGSESKKKRGERGLARANEEKRGEKRGERAVVTPTVRSNTRRHLAPKNFFPDLSSTGFDRLDPVAVSTSSKRRVRISSVPGLHRISAVPAEPIVRPCVHTRSTTRTRRSQQRTTTTMVAKGDRQADARELTFQNN